MQLSPDTTRIAILMPDMRVGGAERVSATHDTAALKARAQYFSINKATDRHLELLFPQHSQRRSEASDRQVHP